ncbi:opsin-5-like [Protopterus annectens]|uniref:opsin-5-like n=1 Tax=Protopterus annectens TaxID=7888 RepID=UPI001CFBEDCC|nr:opsin-5-like [Protopterus annectens]
MVIFIMYKRRRSLEPQDYLTFNLAISDASISMFGYSRGILEIFNIFRDDGFLILIVWTCKVDGFLILLFGLISINTLTAISFIRYIKGCQPHQAHRVNRQSISMVLTGVWIFALFWAGAPLFGWGSYIDRKYGTCEIDWLMASFSTVYKLYVIGIFIFEFFLPVSIMIFSYVSIIKTVRLSHKSSHGGDISERQRRIERNTTQISVVVCTAFLVAWSPYAVISMWSACGFHVPGLTRVLASMFAKSASFYNPLIYIGMNSMFQMEFKQLLQCCYKNNGPTKQALNICEKHGEFSIEKSEKYLVSRAPSPENPDSGVDPGPHDDGSADMNNMVYTVPFDSGSNFDPNRAYRQKSESEYL